MSFVICVGVGGNLVAIQASRISTYLHFWSIPGVLPYKMRQHWPNPWITFFSSGNITVQHRASSPALLSTAACTTVGFVLFLHYIVVKSFCVVSPRGELQVSKGAAHAGYSWTLGVPLCHLSAPGTGVTHL